MADLVRRGSISGSLRPSLGDATVALEHVAARIVPMPRALPPLGPDHALVHE